MIQTNKDGNSNKMDESLLSDHTSNFSNILKDSWAKLFKEHLQIIFNWQLEFIGLSEQKWNSSSSQFDRLGLLSTLIEDYYGPLSKNSLSPFNQFRESLKITNRTFLGELPETLSRPLEMEHILHSSNDSKGEIRGKAVKRFKSRFGINPKAKVPLRKLADFHLEYSSLNRTRGVLRKLQAMESNFQEAWLKTFMSFFGSNEIEGEPNFEALRTLVSNNSNYLQNYLLESANFISEELEKDSLKIGISGIQNIQLQKLAEIPTLEQALVEELEAFSLASDKNNLLLNLLLAQLSIGVSIELNILKTMAEEQLLQPALKQLDTVENWLLQLDQSQKEGLSKLELKEQFSLDELMLNESMQRIQQLAAAVPSEISLPNANNHLQAIDAAYLCDTIIDESIQLPLQGLLFELPSRFASTLSSLAAKVKLVESTQTNKIESGKRNELLKNAVLQCKEQMSWAKEELTEIKEKFDAKLDQLAEKTKGRLNVDSLITEAFVFTKASQRKQRLSAVSEFAEKLSQPFRLYAERINRLLSKTHKDIVYSEFRNRNVANESTHAQLRTFMESISPNTKALDELPFYYQQLFIGKHAPKTNLFHYRKKEMEMARIAINRLELGTGGAIAILGDPLSGRSFFCDMLCLSLEDKSVFRIEAPLNGSSNPNKLYQAIGHQLNSTAIGSKVLDNAPVGSVFLFNDIELWWERHNSGWSALQAFKKLIANYSHKHLFIFNTTPYSYRLMRLKLELDKEIIATIPLSPFAPKDMEKVIRQRHSTGGLVFTLDGKPEHLVSLRQRQALVDDLSDITEGNVGATFHLWLGLMTACDGEIMSLQSPKQKELPILQNKDHLIVLAQMVLHKYIGPKKLSRVLNCSVQEANDKLQNLNRSGLVAEQMGGSFKIVPYVLPFIIRQLKEFQLI